MARHAERGEIDPLVASAATGRDGAVVVAGTAEAGLGEQVSPVHRAVDVSTRPRLREMSR
ncbi:hypothetical protein GBW32_25120 [Streptomyces tsukubensis]|uniref:hypothetical protein n=1 Tax=Streptomyces tsukubensis TaxID=83656 RepID=UPI0012A9C232|nr:hypothetical protein [Streptomyces tsukubensis]QFR95712.1 hypothetical protein GBW32_25120 [Streptomyces tsukubensis]